MSAHARGDGARVVHLRARQKMNLLAQVSAGRAMLRVAVRASAANQNLEERAAFRASPPRVSLRVGRHSHFKLPAINPPAEVFRVVSHCCWCCVVKLVGVESLGEGWEMDEGGRVEGEVEGEWREGEGWVEGWVGGGNCAVAKL